MGKIYWVVALAVAVVSACSQARHTDQAGSIDAGGHSPGPSAMARGQSGQASREVEEILLPFDTYAPDGADIVTILNATDVLLAGCVRSHGLDWRPIARKLPDSPPHRFRYGILEANMAKSFGYHFPVDASDMDNDAKYQARERSLTSRQAVAAYGPDRRSGCWDNAHRALLRDVPKADKRLLDRLETGAFRRSKQQPDVARAIRIWSSCMRVVGYSYADPMEAVGDSRWSSPEATKQEIAIALADVRCKQQSDLLRVWSNTEARLQRDAIRKNLAAFAILRQAKDIWLHNARNVLTRTGH